MWWRQGDEDGMSVRKLLLQVPGTRGTLDRLYKQRARRDTTGSFALRKKTLEFCLFFKHRRHHCTPFKSFHNVNYNIFKRLSNFSVCNFFFSKTPNNLGGKNVWYYSRKTGDETPIKQIHYILASNTMQKAEATLHINQTLTQRGKCLLQRNIMLCLI